MRELVVLRQKKAEKVAYNGDRKNLYEILNVTKELIYSREPSVQYTYDGLNTNLDVTYTDIIYDKQDFYIYDGVVWDCDLILIGERHILLGEAVPTYDEVIKKVQYPTKENDYLKDAILEIQKKENEKLEQYEKEARKFCDAD